MTTNVKQFIEYLQTLPPDTEIDVAVNVDCNWSSYTKYETLELPPQNENGSFQTCSNNIDFMGIDGRGNFLNLGRT